MVEAAAANGWLDRDRAIMETLTAIRRAGAGIILTYWATEVARRLAGGTVRSDRDRFGQHKKFIFAERSVVRALRSAPQRTEPRPGGGTASAARDRGGPLRVDGRPVRLGAHPYRGTRASKETGRACSCDRVGCPAPGAHPVSPTWQMQATVDTNVIASWWQARPEANVILVTGRVFDVLDALAAAGSAALARMEAAWRCGAPGVEPGPGPDAVLRGDQGLPGRRRRMVDLRAGLRAGERHPGPALALPRQLRARPAVGLRRRPVRALASLAAEHPLPDALRLLEYLVDACEA